MADLPEDKLPMDDIDNAAPPPEETQEQKEQRARDESGRFAKAPEGKPDQSARDFRIAQERDEARREAQQAKADHAALQKRLDDMASLAKGEDPNAPPAQSDPMAPVLEKLTGLEQRFTQQDEAAQEAEVHRQVMAYADADEARFRQTTPDFPDATQHYIVSRLTEMKALGVSQEQAEQILTQEANTLLRQCAQAGRSPAEAIYAMSKARGYQGGNVVQFQPQQQPFTPQQEQPSGRRSMGTGGGAAGGGITAAQIAAMDEGDYMAFRSTPEGKRAIQRAMGG